MEIKNAWATDIANIIDHSDIEMLKISLNIKKILMTNYGISEEL
jgi:hypothetical protein